MGDGERKTGLPLLLDFYAAAVAPVTGLHRANDLALETLVDAQTTVDAMVAQGRGPGWLLRQFREGTISWALVAVLVLLVAGLMTLFAGVSRG